MKRINCLSGNALKIIAAVSMLFDHIGLIFFPKIAIFRYIGRLAFPIFAFMIAEGCRYTKNKLRYFLSVAILGLVCQMAYLFTSSSLYIGILISFSVSILLIYLLGEIYRALFAKKWVLMAVLGLAFAASVAAVYIICRKISVDYGFWGCMMPVAASLSHFPKSASEKLRRIDLPLTRVLLMGVCLIMYATSHGGYRMLSLLTLPLLLLYSGERGRWKMKYFFYIFYPLHLVVLWGIFMLIRML